MTVSSATSGTTPTSTSSTPTATSSSTATISTSGTNTSSSIDWSALIQAAVNAKLAQATSITTKITTNQAKIAAYTTLQTALKTMSSDLASLSNSIINSLSGSIYATRTALVTATGDQSASSALSMSLQPGAATGTHTMTISQLATAEKVIGATQSGNSTSLGYSGTFSLGLAGGASESISITPSMKLGDIADAINAQTSTTNVQASVIQLSSGSYALVLTGTQDNADITYSSTSGDDILNKLGMTDSSGAFISSSVLQDAKPALFTLDGIPLTRNTNDISDVLTGVTFDLLATTPTGSTINMDIEPNTDDISTAIQTFANDYNTFRDAVVAQQATNSDGTASSNAVLFGDSTMRSIMDQLQSVLSSSVGGMAIGDIGLEFNAQNELVVSPNASVSLSDALTNNLSGVMSLLAATTTTSSSQLTVINTSSSPESFTLDVQVDSSGNLIGASVNGDSTLFTVSNNQITGTGNGPYAGMAFSYTGSTSQSIQVTSTMGLAAQLTTAANQATDVNNGTLTQLISSLTDQDTSYQSQVNDIQSAAATLQAQLQSQYATYQAAIAGADNTLTYLKALLNAGSNN